jgi:hypothetical protein
MVGPEETTALSIELLLNRRYELRRSAIRLRRMSANRMLDFTTASQALDNDAVLRGLSRYATHLQAFRSAATEHASAETSSSQLCGIVWRKHPCASSTRS